MRAAPILKAIGCPHLSLVDGRGYWYFVYDRPTENRDAVNSRGDYDTVSVPGDYDTTSIYVMRLSDLPAEQWVEDGREFVAKMEAR